MACRKGSRDCGDACSVRGEGVRSGGVRGRGVRGWRDMWCFISSALHCFLCSGVMEEGSGGEREREKERERERERETELIEI